MSISNDTSGRLHAVAARNIEFYRPEPDGLPWELLDAGAAELGSEALERELDLDYTRIACQIEPAETLGIYAMRRRTPTRFELISLSVMAGFEHQLLGRRLLGHALGLAESKAGREVELGVCADNDRALAVLQRYGFTRVTADDIKDASAAIVRMRFELTAE